MQNMTLPKSNNLQNSQKVIMIKKLNKRVADTGRDGDTILQDCWDEAETEISGLFDEVAGIWSRSHDKPSIELMFESMLGISWSDFLDRCIKELR